MKKEGDLSKRLAPINLKLIIVGVVVIAIGILLMALGESSSAMQASGFSPMHLQAYRYTSGIGLP